jgi:hypothetical protein
MSIDNGPENSEASPANQEILDLSGLPVPVALEIQRLVETLRGNLAGESARADRGEESPEQWATRLQAWIDSHPTRATDFDDSRESIYAGRGE